MRIDSLRVAAALICCATTALAQNTQQEELKYAVVVSRHGVRSPTYTPERLNQYSASPWPDWGVAPGNLTTHGRALMKLMGGFYRDYFASTGLLGKPDCGEDSRVYFRADNAQRTMVTAEALAEGILPGCKVDIHSLGAGKNDPLFDGSEAGSAKSDSALSMAVVAARLGPKPDALTDAHRPSLDLLARMLNGNGKAARSVFDEPVALTASKGAVSMSGPLSIASTLTEDFLLEYADGMSGDRLGWGHLNASNLLELMSLHSAYADLMRRTPYLARTRGSNLLSHVVSSLEQAQAAKPVPGAIGSPGTELLVISGHDTNLSNLSGMLGLSWLLPSYQADDTPPGGALIFTLWRSTATGRFSVRLQYIAQTLDQMHDATPLSNGHPPAMANVFVPACSAATEGYPCSWESFLAAARSAIAPEFVAK